MGKRKRRSTIEAGRKREWTPPSIHVLCTVLYILPRILCGDSTAMRQLMQGICTSLRTALPTPRGTSYSGRSHRSRRHRFNTYWTNRFTASTLKRWPFVSPRRETLLTYSHALFLYLFYLKCNINVFHLYWIHKLCFSNKRRVRDVWGLSVFVYLSS